MWRVVVSSSSSLASSTRGASHASLSCVRFASPRLTTKNSIVVRRWLSEGATKKPEATAASSVVQEASKKTTSGGWWHSAEFWGGMGALAGWGMSGAAIYDATLQGPEVISLNMTCVLIVYSTLFCRWAYIVKPQNLLLASCHAANVVAQTNQLRRALEHKMATGQEADVYKMQKDATKYGAVGIAAILGGPYIRKALSDANLGIVSTVAAADAGPFTVHFWAPMSKWMISGASFLDLNRPTDKVSLPQYTALTMTGFFFSRYALLVTPINFTLCSVNIALFASSAWHLGRKIHADYIKGNDKK